MKRGFTLVELSIVLVIIGLLVGGILVGQSLVDSAKIGQAVRQIQQYDIAVSNFLEKFKQLPGDSSLMSPPGNNNKQVIDEVAGFTCGLSTCREYMSFWKHLTDSKALKGDFGNSYFGTEPDEDSAPTIFEASIFPTSSISNSFRPEGWYYNSYLNDGYHGASDGGQAKGQSLIPLDNKIDDSDTATGYFRAANNWTDGSKCTASSNACTFYMTIMSTNGRPMDKY